MRLSEQYRTVIKQTTREVWGDQASIVLFGSRMDDTIRGGDIDLLVNPKTKLTAQELVRNKIRFLSQLDIQLGEQKIDLIVLTDENRTMGIVRTALQTGIEL